jgi:hypothetical protein
VFWYLFCASLLWLYASPLLFHDSFFQLNSDEANYVWKAEHISRVTVLLHKPVGYVSGQPEPGYRPAVTLIVPDNRFAGDNPSPSFERDHLKGLAPAGRQRSVDQPDRNPCGKSKKRPDGKELAGSINIGVNQINAPLNGSKFRVRRVDALALNFER